MHKVFQAAASGSNGIFKRRPDRFDQTLALRKRQATDRFGRMDPGTEQTFRGVDIPHTDNPVRVHEEKLGRRLAATRHRVQCLRIEPGRQRFQPQPPEQTRLFDRRIEKQHRTKTPRIAQTQNPGTEDQVHMIMSPRFQIRTDHTQAAGHPQVQQQNLLAEIQQKILGAARHGANLLADQRLAQAGRKRVAQPRMAQHHTRNPLAQQMGLDTTPGYFDFGKFRHKSLVWLIADNMRIIPIPQDLAAQIIATRMLPTKLFKQVMQLACISLMFGGSSAFAQGTHNGSGEKNKTASKPVSSAQFIYQSLLSEIAVQRGAVKTAVVTYIDLARKTNDGRIARRATELALQAQDIALASEAARLWLNLEPESQAALQTLTAITAENNQTPETLEASLKAQLSQQAAKRGALLMQLPQLMGRFKDAKLNREAMLRLSEPYLHLPEAHYVRSIAAALAQDTDSAMAEAATALEQRPDWEDAIVLLWRVSPAARQSETVKRLKAFGDQNPKAAEARLSYIRWLAQEKRREEVVQTTQQLLNDFPDNDDLRYASMSVLVEAGELRGAETLLRQLIERGYRETDLLKLQLGQLTEEQAQPEAALKAYAEVQPGQYFASAAERQARLLFKLGRLDEARKLLQDAIQTQPTDIIPLQLAEADILRMANKPAASFDVLELVLALDADNIDALYMSALAAESLGKYEIMEHRLRRVIELKPDYAHAYNALGYSFADRNVHLDEAEKLLAQAIKLAPEDPAILDSVGWLRFRQGDYPAARAFIQKAMKLFNDPEIVMHNIEILWVSGQKDEARAMFKEIRKTERANDQLKKLENRLGL